MAATPSVRDGSDTGQADTAHCDGIHHRMRVVGYLLGPRPAWLDCDKPLRVVCRGCSYETRWRCDGHRESRCRRCAGRYRRRVRRVAESGTTRVGGRQYLLTFTAPGQRQHALPSGSICPCTPAGGVDLARWNASHSRRWNHLRTSIRREYPDLEFFRGVELQLRGALHDHAMVWTPQPVSKRRLRELALAAGFGHSVDVAPITSPAQVGYYVSKYVTKATDARDDVPWWGEEVDYETGEVTEGLIPGRYRTWSMSRHWGLTMKAVRAEGLAFVQAQQAALETEALDLLARELGAQLLPDETSPPHSP